MRRRSTEKYDGFTGARKSPANHSAYPANRSVPREMASLAAVAASRNSSSSPALEEGERYNSEKRRAALAVEMEDLGLEPAYHLIGCLYINKSVSDRLQSSFEGVVLPSLFTKIFGRLAIISGLIPSASMGIAAFLLANLAFAAGPIALIAGIVRFTYVLVKDLRAGKPWKEALINASKEALKTAVKFFIVYMIWVLAIAAATALGILSGPLLPLGIVVVGIITALGFMLATFIVDKMPAIINAIWTNGLKASLSTLKEKLHELKSGILPGLLEGSSWTLMDNNLINISGHIAGLGGKILDLVGISLIVSGCFFIGAVIQGSLARRRTISKLPKKSDDPVTRQRIQRSIEKTVHDKENPFVALRRLKAESHDPRVQALLIQYMQAHIILMALSQALVASAQLQATDDLELSEDQESWIKDLPPHAVTAASGGLFSRGDYTPREELQRVKDIATDITSQRTSKRALKNARQLQTKVGTRRTNAMNALKDQYGIFAPTCRSPVQHIHSNQIDRVHHRIEYAF